MSASAKAPCYYPTNPARNQRNRGGTMRIGVSRLAIGAACILAIALRCLPAAHADDAAAFYTGRNLNLIEGFNTGGGADLYTRLVAAHWAHHIPGHPNVIVHNMPGAGSMTAANHLFNVSPRDGSEIALFAGNIAVDPVIGGVPSQYDSRKFNWLGAPAAETDVCVAAKNSSFKTFDDVLQREMVTGAAGTSTLDFPVVINSLLGAKFKLVKGYKGSAGLRLALERGEIEGFCGLGLDSLHSLGLNDQRVTILVQTALKSDPRLPGVPIITDYAKSAEQRQVMQLIFGWLVMDRTFAAPPDVPADRVAALRAAFDATMADPAFRADVEKAALSLSPMRGQDIQNFVDEVYRTPEAVARKAAQLLGRNVP
jgi:tripartite-type tricarboxylate transporter receptor subunit TctC